LNLLLPLNKALTLWPDREALVEGDLRFTYRELGKRVGALAQALKALGLTKGDRVAILAPNGYKFLECYYAHPLAGLVLMPINIRQSHDEIAAILKDSDASLLIAHNDFADLVSKVMAESPFVKGVIWLDQIPAALKLNCKQHQYDELLANQPEAPFPETLPDASDLAQLYYTSGTTGKPKGVMLTHANVTFHALAASLELSLTESDAWFHIAPMFHLADAWSVFSVTWVGGKHVFIPYFKTEDVLKTIEKEGVSLLAMVPTMANALVHDPSLASHNYASLRMFLTAGSPIAPELVRKIVEAFGCQYVQYYGMTETSPLLTLSLLKAHHNALPHQERIRIASRTGRSFLGVELKVVRENGQDVAADDREVGEIVARGPCVTPGYLNQPEATAQLIKDGWLHTGDLAVIDQEGYVNIVDRKKDMIITGGENVYSTEVEYVLYEHQAVLECAVFGLPDATWGETVKAIVVLKPGQSTDERALINFVRSKIAAYKAPRSIDFVSQLPRTGSGKIFKRGLRDQYLGAAATRKL
jgi:acyl-CoA synthetase (AMP-forming)/AMP-acid ligase II